MCKCSRVYKRIERQHLPECQYSQSCYIIISSYNNCAKEPHDIFMNAKGKFNAAITSRNLLQFVNFIKSHKPTVSRQSCHFASDRCMNELPTLHQIHSLAAWSLERMEPRHWKTIPCNSSSSSSRSISRSSSNSSRFICKAK